MPERGDGLMTIQPMNQATVEKLLAALRGALGTIPLVPDIGVAGPSLRQFDGVYGTMSSASDPSRDSKERRTESTV